MRRPRYDTCQKNRGTNFGLLLLHLKHTHAQIIPGAGRTTDSLILNQNMFPLQQYETNFSSLILCTHKHFQALTRKCTSNNQHLIPLAHVQKLITSGMQATHTGGFPTKQNHSTTTKAFCIRPSIRNADNTGCNSYYATQTTTWLSVRREHWHLHLHSPYSLSLLLRGIGLTSLAPSPARQPVYLPSRFLLSRPS
jgi:hypothetical protein